MREAIVDTPDPFTVLAAPATSSGAQTTMGFRFFRSISCFYRGDGDSRGLATVLIAIGWLMALPPTAFFQEPAGNAAGFWSAAFKISEDPIVYAFLGAYFFALQMLFRRFVREDLRKSAYLAVSLRIILAVLGTWVAIKAITAIGKMDEKAASLLIVGFVIGVFPRIAWQFIQGAWKFLMRKLHLSAVLPSMESKLPVSDLDGLTVWHEARLEEEDIENIPNMASRDHCLMLRPLASPSSPALSCVDQAILFSIFLGQKSDAHLGVDSLAFRPLGCIGLMARFIEGSSAAGFYRDRHRAWVAAMLRQFAPPNKFSWHQEILNHGLRGITDIQRSGFAFRLFKVSIFRLQ